MKRILWAVVSLLAIALTVPASTVSRSVYVPDLGGLGVQVTEALRAQEVPLAVVSSAETADVTVSIRSMYSSDITRNLVAGKLGRTADHVLTAVDRKTGKTLLSYEFSMRPGDEARKHAARTFVSRLKQKL